MSKLIYTSDNMEFNSKSAEVRRSKRPRINNTKDSRIVNNSNKTCRNICNSNDSDIEIEICGIRTNDVSLLKFAMGVKKSIEEFRSQSLNKH